MTELKVANVVGMITYQQELDLAALAETFEDRDEITGVTYEPAENHWLQTRFTPADTYVAFYRTGRCSIAGCRSIEHFETMVDRVNEVMRELLDFEYEPAAEISNIVATSDLGSPIPLELLSLELGMDAVEFDRGVLESDDAPPGTIAAADNGDDDGPGGPPSDPDPTPIDEIAPSKQPFASVVGEVEFGEYDGYSADDSDGPAWTATLNDGTGTAELVAWEEADVPGFYNDRGVFEPDVLKVSAAKAGEYDGRVQLAIGERTTVSTPPEDEAQTVISDNADEEEDDSNDAGADGDDTAEAAADGGEAVPVSGLEGTHGKLVTTLRDAGGPLSLPELFGRADVNPGEARAMLDRLSEKYGWVVINEDGDETTVELDR